MQFVSWTINPSPSGKEGIFFTAEVLCFFVLGFFSVEAWFIDSPELSNLTNCIFKFWSNTTLRLVLYLCTHVLNSLNCGWTHCKVLTRIWHHMTSRYKDWNKHIIACFVFLISFLLGISQKFVYENHFGAK